MTQDQRYALVISRLEAAKGAVHLASMLSDHLRVPTRHEHEAIVNLASSICADIKHVIKQVDV